MFILVFSGLIDNKCLFIITTIVLLIFRHPTKLLRKISKEDDAIFIKTIKCIFCMGFGVIFLLLPELKLVIAIILPLIKKFGDKLINYLFDDDNDF